VRKVPSKVVSASEDSLIERIRKGEAELFHDLVHPHERSVYLTALSIVENEADAEEVAQETLLKAWRRLDQFRGEARFSTWLIRIAINESKMRRRKDHRQHLFEPIEREDEDGNAAPRDFADWREIPSETLERKEVRTALMRALRSLREPYREVFLLRDVQHLNVDETAQALGISISAVKSRLLRARLQMRERLAPLFRVRWIDRLPLFAERRR
jgi:RNA polymerase sigma-70 factor, ECF subfamily